MKSLIKTLLSLICSLVIYDTTLAVDYQGFIQEQNYSYASYIQYSDDGSSYFTAKNRDGENYIIYNFEQYGPYTNIGQSLVVFERNHISFVVWEKDTAYVFINGKLSDAYKDIRGLYISPNKKHFAYIAWDGESDILVKDGEVIDKYPNIQNFAFSNPYGDEYNFVSANEKESVFYRNKEAITAVPNIVDGVVAQSGDYAYIARGEKNRKVYSSLGDSAEYENVGDLVIAPDGGGYAFKAQDKGRWFMVINGEEYNDFDMAYGVKYGQRARDFVYIAERGLEKILIKNRDEVGKFEQVKEWKFVDGGVLQYVGYHKGEQISGEY